MSKHFFWNALFLLFRNILASDRAVVGMNLSFDPDLSCLLARDGFVLGSTFKHISEQTTYVRLLDGTDFDILNQSAEENSIKQHSKG
jgi:hypothetical protein